MDNYNRNLVIPLKKIHLLTVLRSHHFLGPKTLFILHPSAPYLFQSGPALAYPALSSLFSFPSLEMSQINSTDVFFVYIFTILIYYTWRILLILLVKFCFNKFYWPMTIL